MFSNSMNKYLIVILCFIGFSIFIKLYNSELKKKYGDNYACKDILNKTLVSFFNLKGCIWNIIHIIIYFGLCVLINSKLNVFKHIIVFFIGLLWYFFAPYSNKLNNPNKCVDTVYSDTNIPREDDILFNFSGQILYIFFYSLTK
jgi:hypothetical protein